MLKHPLTMDPHSEFCLESNIPILPMGKLKLSDSEAWPCPFLQD